MDFILGGFILILTTFVCDFIFHKIETPTFRFFTIALILFFVIFIWAELAVGILENIQ